MVERLAVIRAFSFYQSTSETNINQSLKQTVFSCIFLGCFLYCFQDWLMYFHSIAVFLWICLQNVWILQGTAVALKDRSSSARSGALCRAAAFSTSKSPESRVETRRETKNLSWYVVGQNVCDSCHIKTNKTNISKHILKMFKLTLHTVLFLGDKNQHSPSMSNPPASRSKHSLQISWINSFHLTRDIVH